MEDSSLSLVRFCVMNFWAVVINSRPFQPTSSVLLKLVEGLIQSEPEPDEEIKKRIKWIYDNTHEKVNIPISIIELAVFKNLDRGLNREIQIGDKEFNLTTLYQYLNEITFELSRIVIDVAKKYAIDMPTTFLQGGNQQVKIE